MKGMGIQYLSTAQIASMMGMNLMSALLTATEERKRILKIKIIGCSDSAWWYDSRIGEIFDVVDMDEEDFWVFDSLSIIKECCISREDCRELVAEEYEELEDVNSYDSSFNYLLEQSEKYSLLRKNGIDYLVKKLMFTEQEATKLIDKLSTKQED